MRILGIDPGLTITGYGCVDLANGSFDPTLVEAGIIRLASRAPMEDRLEQLFQELTDLIDDLTPDRMVVEKLFAHYKHVRTSILMGHARGVVLLAGRVRGVELGELAATEVKKAVTGRGHASKHQVQHAIATQFAMREVPQPSDVADAIAVALCASRRLACEV
jgi:crossover junction endodeoxyribonuclease RuvC